ncbi:MAG: hypothetical protein ACRERV_06725 [Methylococcales bacterium]
MKRNDSFLWALNLLAMAVVLPTSALAKTKPLDKAILSSESFINAHPDLMHRTRGLAAYKKSRYTEAFTHFQRGAKFSDKPSQGMLAEMLWKGEGVAVNRPLAYAWMDLAAERLYPTMLAHREKYWASLTTQEREHAIEMGRGLYEIYGDDVAKKRLARALRQAKSKVTGSRTGMVGSLSITIFTSSGPETIDGSQYYQDKFWKPEQYFKWQDTAWKNPPKGNVSIGPLQTTPSLLPEADKKKP